jgi:hypothetical protein
MISTSPNNIRKRLLTRRIFLLALSFPAIVFVFVMLFPYFSMADEPRLSIQSPVINLGVIDSEPTEERKVTFEIFNKGKGQLLINRIKASCPCLEPSLDRPNLASGEKANLTMSVTPPLRPGKWQDTVLLFSNDPRKKVTKLTIEAFIEFRCNVTPASLFINDLDTDHAQHVDLTILGPTNDLSFRVLNASGNSDAIELSEIYETGIVQQNKRKAWKVRLSVKGRGLRSWKDKISISTTDVKMPSLEVPLTVRESQDIIVKPRMISLTKSRNDNQSSSIIEITRTNTEYMLECVKVDTPEWICIQEIEKEVGSLDKLCFRVNVDESNKPGLYQGEISIFLKGHPLPIKIPVLLFCRDD